MIGMRACCQSSAEEKDVWARGAACWRPGNRQDCAGACCEPGIGNESAVLSDCGQ